MCVCEGVGGVSGKGVRGRGWGEGGGMGERGKGGKRKKGGGRKKGREGQGEEVRGERGSVRGKYKKRECRGRWEEKMCEKGW